MNPLKAADDGVLRSAIVTSDRPSTSPPSPRHEPDWISGGSYSPEPSVHGRAPDGASGYAVVLVDADSVRCAERRALLTHGGAARVITATDEFDVADAMRLMDPDVVIVSASDTLLGGKLLRAVRGLFDAHHEPVPVLAWRSPLSLQGTPTELMAAGADAVLDEGASIEQLLATVRALRRVIASATRRSAREIAPSQTVLDAVQLSVALVDRDGRVCEANTTLQTLWQEMTGQRSSPVGHDMAHLLVPADRDALAAAVLDICDAAAGTVSELECAMGVSSMRGIPVRVRLVRLEEPTAGAVVVAQFTDLRERRRAEEQLRATRWRALDRQQMIDVTGRLRSVLAAAGQAVGAARSGRGSGEVMLSSTQAALLRGTLTQSEQLLDALQAIATEQEHPAALVEMRALVETHLALFRQMVPSYITLTAETGSGDVMVRGSEAQLQQVLTALVMNAWDAQRSGGAIHVTVRHTDDVVIVGVEDEGPGVPEEQADWIFLPMTSTRSAEGASGMGLVTARRAAELHGGQLRLDRYREQGARFELILPRYRARTADVRTPVPATPPRGVAAGI